MWVFVIYVVNSFPEPFVPGSNQKLNLKKRDLVTFIETPEGVLIRPSEVVVSSTLDEIGRALKEKGITLEELLESARQIRGELINEEYQLSDNKSK